jgi:hypothetical protein
MPKIELGRIGAVISPAEDNGFVDTAVQLDELGYQTIWITGGPLQRLSQNVSGHGKNPGARPVSSRWL